MCNFVRYDRPFSETENEMRDECSAQICQDVGTVGIPMDASHPSKMKEEEIPDPPRPMFQRSKDGGEGGLEARR